MHVLVTQVSVAAPLLHLTTEVAHPLTTTDQQQQACLHLIASCRTAHHHTWLLGQLVETETTGALIPP